MKKYLITRNPTMTPCDVLREYLTINYLHTVLDSTFNPIKHTPIPLSKCVLPCHNPCTNL